MQWQQHESLQCCKHPRTSAYHQLSWLCGLLYHVCYPHKDFLLWLHYQTSARSFPIRYHYCCFFSDKSDVIHLACPQQWRCPPFSMSLIAYLSNAPCRFIDAARNGCPHLQHLSGSVSTPIESGYMCPQLLWRETQSTLLLTLSYLFGTGDPSNEILIPPNPLLRQSLWPALGTTA